MASPDLFPLDVPLTPSVDRIEPVLWLKRVVILSDLDPDSTIIRDVTFRRGLNIVQTRRRPSGEASIVGHSVGKTLLLRLIRYSLGEPHFAVETVRRRIAAKFPSAHLVAHWRLNGADFVVVRPFQESRTSKPFAVQDNDWQHAIIDWEHGIPFSEFLDSIHQVLIAPLPTFNYCHPRRGPRWLDVLGWLARDHECAYRAFNEWRHKDADSSPTLDRDDASLLLQWLVGLVEDQEIRLRELHEGLLAERRKATSDRDKAQQVVDITGPQLRTKLEVTDDDGPGMFAKNVIEVASQKIASLERLRNERQEASHVDDLLSAEEVAREEFVDADATVRSVTDRIKWLEGRIRQIETANEISPYAVSSRFERCPKDDCPLKLANRAEPARDPSENEHVATIRAEVSTLSSELAEREQVRELCRGAYARARQLAQQERERIMQETAGIDRDIGRWQSYETDAAKYSAAQKSISELEQAIEALGTKIDQSNETQEAARQQFADRLRRLSGCFDRTLKDVFGEEAGGRIVVDGHGLRPVPDDRLAPNGAALSTMTTVLAFDIACLKASIAGIGHHPRFLLHDSPREGDMEEPLFHRLFQITRDLETLFGEQEPSFQYIVTTTTPPPDELSNEAGPYVRLTLDARNDMDRLLGASF